MAKNTESLARKQLDEFIRQRNMIAHRGPSYQTVGASVVRGYLEYFGGLVPAIAETMEQRLVTVAAKSVQPVP